MRIRYTRRYRPIRLNRSKNPPSRSGWKMRPKNGDINLTRSEPGFYDPVH
jgi:hypothetical protein